MSINKIEHHGTYADLTFKKVDLSKQVIQEATFTECKFVRCEFSETDFQACRLIDCQFDDCTMKMTKVTDSTFSKVRFSTCNLLGVDWTKANWSEWAVKMTALEFSACNLEYGVFFGLALKKLKLKDCNAREVNFAEADLSEADFSGTDLAGAVFLRTTLTKANFVGAKNYGLSLNDNKTKGAKFALPEAIRLLYHLNIEIINPETNEALTTEDLDGLM